MILSPFLHLDEDRLSKRRSIGETISLQVEVESRNSPEKEEVCHSQCTLFWLGSANINQMRNGWLGIYYQPCEVLFALFWTSLPNIILFEMLFHFISIMEQYFKDLTILCTGLLDSFAQTNKKWRALKWIICNRTLIGLLHPICLFIV